MNTKKSPALTAGISLLIMTIIAPIANFAILEKLLVPNNATSTFANISSSESSFRIAICLFLIVAVLDILVAWGLYIFLKPLNKSLSLLCAWLRIVYTAMLGSALFNLINILPALKFNNSQVQEHVYQLFTGFTSLWEFSLIIFSFHLLTLGYLFFKAGYMKKILGIFLIIASFGYIIDGFGKLLSSSYNFEVAIFTFWGEVVLIFWLLIVGWRVKE